MKWTRKPEAREMAAPAAPKPPEEPRRLTLHIEELEPRLAPQSSTSILD